MYRNITFIISLSLLFQLAPGITLAQQAAARCSLDGFLSSSILERSTVLVTDSEQSLVLPFVVTNNSQHYSYSGVDIGIGLYQKSEATHPVFWSPIATSTEFFPNISQTFIPSVDVTAVPAGEYVARIGVAQGGQLAALANSRLNDGVTVTKSVDASGYVASLARTDQTTAPGKPIEFTLTTQNNTEFVEQDYHQHIAIVRGDTPLGSAVRHTLSESVKIIPGGTEVTNISMQLVANGEYTTFGYFTKPNTLLPVVVDTFSVGTAISAQDVFISGVGIQSLDQPGGELEAVTCVASVSGEPFDVMQLEQSVLVGADILESTIADVTRNQSVAVRFSKSDLSNFTIESNLYQNQTQSNEDAASNGTVGSLVHSITQDYVCGNGCQAETIGAKWNSFTAEDTFRSSVWFYLGILSASLLLFFLMLGRLAQTKKEEEQMHKPQ